MFKHLEDCFENERDIEQYLEVQNNLQEPTRTILPYMLDVSALLSKSGLKEQYALFGGYAVLSHLMATYGPYAAISWRGSNDIDMAGTQKVLSVLVSGFSIDSNRKSPNVTDKRTIKLHDENEQECRIDFFVGDFEKRFGKPVTNTHFGVDVSVVEPLALIRSKLQTPVREVQHAEDILGLISVLEKKGYTEDKVASFYRSNEVSSLIDRIDLGVGNSSDDRHGFLPGKKYLEVVRKMLHKRRPV